MQINVACSETSFRSRSWVLWFLLFLHITHKIKNSILKLVNYTVNHFRKLHKFSIWLKSTRQDGLFIKWALVKTILFRPSLPECDGMLLGIKRIFSKYFPFLNHGSTCALKYQWIHELLSGSRHGSKKTWNSLLFF